MAARGRVRNRCILVSPPRCSPRANPSSWWRCAGDVMADNVRSKRRREHQKPRSASAPSIFKAYNKRQLLADARALSGGGEIKVNDAVTKLLDERLMAKRRSSSRRWNSMQAMPTSVEPHSCERRRAQSCTWQPTARRFGNRTRFRLKGGRQPTGLMERFFKVTMPMGPGRMEFRSPITGRTAATE